MAESAVGLSNPTLAFGVGHLSSYSSSQPFIDLALVRRPWVASTPDGPVKDEALDTYLDDGNWPTSIPEGASGVHTLWNWSSDPADGAEGRKGVYIIEYEGDGTVVVTGTGKVLSQEDGRIVFENVKGGQMRVTITETDPNGDGDYIRNLTMIRAEHEDLFEAGAMFNPDWIAAVQDSRQLRFMDWMEINNSIVSDWSERPTLSSGNWETAGVPVEVMVRLANETGIDPWFNMPLLASEEYVKEFATYVRDHLDPRLKASVEFSNEVWNGSFKQLAQLREGFAEDWPDASMSGAGAMHYHSKRMTENALIWDEVFGEESDTRLFKVLATQTTSAYRTEKLLNPTTWFAQEPDSAVNPAEVFDAIGVTTYFGGRAARDNEYREELIAKIEDPNVDAVQWLYEKLLDPDYLGSLPNLLLFLEDQRAIADAHGLRMVAYEGGQHVHHLYNVRGTTADQLSVLDGFFRDFVRSPQMADLYERLWDAWSEVGDGPFMQYGFIGNASKWGSWAVSDYLGDVTPRAAALERLNAEQAPWWIDGDREDAFLQGVIRTGDAGDDTLFGTREEDTLLGGVGDDVLVGGMGDDRLSGGAGQDAAVFSGLSAGYRIRSEGHGFRIEGGDGSDFLVNVETLVFQDRTVALSNLSPALAGTELSTSVLPTADLPALIVASRMELSGSAGADQLRGTAAHEHLTGSGGDDVLYGEGGDDVILGDTGRDKLYGGAGDDVIDGGEGSDLLWGGEGNDVFIVGQGLDRIYDFEAGDMLDLRPLGLALGGNLNSIAYENAHGNLCIGSNGAEVRLVGLTLEDLGWVDAILA